MKVKVLSADPAEVKIPALVVLLYEEDKPGLKNRPELKNLSKFINPRLKAKDFEAKPGACLTLYPAKANAERLILVGMGPKAKCGPIQLKAAAALGSSTAKAQQAGSAALALPPLTDLDEQSCAEIISLGASLGQYSFDELKSSADLKPALQELALIRQPGKGLAAVRKAAQDGAILADSVAWARDMGNRPANLFYPEIMAAEAQNMAQASGITCQIITPAQAQKKGMGAFVGVGQGSQRPGRIIILNYQGGPAGGKPVVLVGKAITFDSGGISLKNREGMGDMKGDMSGGGAVLATLQAAAALKLKLNLIGIVAAAENMPDGGAYRPGDVLKAMNGKSIEIISTDAEGRLVLADALTLAQSYNPKAVVDLATLTGACVVALGGSCAAIMGNSPGLISELREASGRSGEMIWELPLVDEYNELIKSPVADIKNSGGRWGGSIIGGLFLQNFVEDKTAWAHMDIAGPAFMDKSSPGLPEGASGFGVQLLIKWLRS